MKLILASGSERRRHLLSWLGLPFEVAVSDFDENSVVEGDPARLVKRLAREKAKVVADRFGEGLVIGADTVIAIEGEVIGKPESREDAVRILTKLSGKTHAVFTGVCVINTKTNKELVEAERTEVTFRKLSEKEIVDYVATGEPLDKGGAYAIQMGARGFVSKVEGSYTNVVGLPLLVVVKLLKRQNYPVNKDVAKIIYERTGYRK